MIKDFTAARIWGCYLEIDKAKKLLSEMEKRTENHEDPNPEDPFGRRNCLQLGVPRGDNGRMIYQVKPKLAMSVIRAHIANKEAELREANEQARIELWEAADSSPNSPKGGN